MIKINIHLVIIINLVFCLIGSNSFADEIIVGYDEDSLPVLNEELRYSRERLSQIESDISDIDLTGEVSGILPIANGGTSASLVDPDDDRVFFWDDSAGTSDFLDMGTGLTITGTTLNVEKPPLGIEIFTVPGADSWTVPSGVYEVWVYMIGGGGGGGGAIAGGGSGAGGDGGGGGATLYTKTPYPVTPSSSIDYTVGAGGAGGAGLDGADGTASVFDTNLTADYGNGGSRADNAPDSAGGDGSASSAGDGNADTTGGVIGGWEGYSDGGDGGQTTGDNGGGGGGTTLGAGGDGGTQSIPNTSASDGNDGSYGSGGGGGAKSSGGQPLTTGGDGGDGIIIIIY